MNGHNVYAKLWELAHDDKVSGHWDHVEVRGWLETAAFPALVGEGHCHRCHGFEDGPCHDEHDGHHGCPACQQEALTEEAGLDQFQRWAGLRD